MHHRWILLLVFTVAVSADDSTTTTTTAATTVPPEEPPYFDTPVDVSSFDVECDAVAAWLDYERNVGDAVTLAANQPKVTLEHLEANKVRGWKPQSPPAEGFHPSTATLLCITYTYEKKHPQAAVIHNSWGKRCTRHIIVTNKPSVDGVDQTDVLSLEPRGGEHNDNLWMKTVAILEALASRSDLSDYDYYFMGGDDVMMMPSNLRRLISEPGNTLMHRAGTPLFFGTRFVFAPGDQVHINLDDWRSIDTLGTWDTQTEFLSGAGYVFNRHALHVVVQGTQNRLCNPDLRSHAEDVYIAGCFQNFGVLPRDTRDAQGEDRVQVMTPYHMAVQSQNTAYTWWFRDYKPVPTPLGSEIASKHSFVWHYMGPGDVRKMTGLYESD
jgi:hypothetical protein